MRRDEEPSARAKADEDEENEQDRKARLRVGAFGATEWVLSGCPTSLVERMYMYSMQSLSPLSFPHSSVPPYPFLDAKYATPNKVENAADGVKKEGVGDAFLGPLANPALWSSLYCGKRPPFVDTESFGFEQPVVRRSAWSLLQTLVQRCKGK